MDMVLPGGAERAAVADRKRRGAPRYRVVAGAASHHIVELNDAGFVIEADGRPPLRGYADIMQGDERVLRGLVVCTWARNGLVGYEFKRETAGLAVPADYVLPAHSGLLTAQS
ncbi:MAG: hypothetical protein AAGB15_00685 [Pseudomonadota bacterium]